MFTDGVPDEFIETVNWLHYLNYKAIPCCSITWHLFVLGTSYNYCLFLIALEIFQLGQNNFFQFDQISGEVLQLCSHLPWWIEMLNFPMLLPLVVVSDGPGALLL